MIEVFLGSIINNGEINYDYISKCSHSVNSLTISAIIEQESGFNQFAIGVNTGERLKSQPVTLDEAIEKANELISAGHSIDLGLGQINSNNLDWLGLSVENAFNGCENIKAMNKVLSHNYKLVFDERFDHESNLKKAISMYNTGSASRGFDNGYVVSVQEKALNQLKNIPLGNTSESIANVNEVHIPVIESAPKSKPLEADAVDSFKSYSNQKNSEKDGKLYSRERSEHINDTQSNK